MGVFTTKFNDFQPEIQKDEDKTNIESTIWGDVFKPNKFNPQEYSNINKSNIPFSTDLNYFDALNETRARNQSGLGLIGKSAFQAITSTAGMLVSSVGALTHPLAILSKEHEDNTLDIIGQAITNIGQDAAPIYLTKKAQESFDLSEPTTLASGAPSVFSSVAMMIPALGVTKGIGLLGTGLSKLENVSKVLGFAGKGLEALGTTQFGAALTTGITARHIDSYLSSAQTYQQLYDDSIKLGMNPDTAKDYAGDGARKSYQLGMLNTAFDVAELSILLKGTSYLSRNLKTLSKTENEALFKTIGTDKNNVLNNIISESVQQTLEKPNTWKNIIVNYAKVVGLEAADEMTMDIAQNEGKYYVEHKYRIDTSKSTFADRFADTMTQANTLQDGFWGAIGGLVMQAGSGIMSRSLFKQHFDNEENRITDFINRNNNLRTKIKDIQNLQDQGNNYEAEQVYQDLVNNIVASGIKNGTIDLDIKTLENLTKINFEKLTDEQKTSLINDGFNDKSPQIANELLSRIKESKNIFDKHLKKDYTKGINLKDSSFNNEEMKNYLSTIASSIESGIETRKSIINKANIEEEELRKIITENTNGTDNPSVSTYIQSLAQKKATEINIENYNNEINKRNKIINSIKQTLINNENIAKIESKKRNKPISIDQIEEQFLNNQIDGQNESIKILEKKQKYFKDILENINKEVNKHEIDIQNFKDNQSNINVEGYTKKPTAYSQNTIDEIEKSLNDKNYLNNISKLSIIQKQIQSLEHDQQIDNNNLAFFIGDSKYREKIANNTIDSHKQQIQEKRNDFIKGYDEINKNNEDIDETIDQINDFIKIAEKEPYVNDLVNKAKNDLIGLQKRKEEINKNKQDIPIIKKDISDAPIEKINAIPEVDLNDLKTELKQPFINLNDNTELKPDYITNITESKSKIDFYKPINNEKSKLINDTNKILDDFDKELHSNFFITKDDAKVRPNKSKEDIKKAIINLNTLKDNYLKQIKSGNIDVDKELKETYNGNPYLDINTNSSKPGAPHIFKDLNKINKLISEINNSSKDNKVTLDFSINSTTETVKNINDFIDNKFSDETQRVFVRNSIGNSITDLLKITDTDNLKIKQEEIKNKLEELYSDLEQQINIKFSKDLKERLPINDIDFKDKELDNRLSEISFILDSRNFMSALRMYTNKIARGELGRGTLFKFVTYSDLMTGVYLTNPELIPILYESVNNALIMRSNVLYDDNYSIKVGDSKVLLGEILESNPIKLYINPDVIKRDEFIPNLIKKLDTIVENSKRYDPIEGVYVTLPSFDEGRPNVTSIMELQPNNIPNHKTFVDFINTINNLDSDSNITINTTGSGLETQIDVISNGIKIGEISKPYFIYNNVEYSTKIGDTYQFRNPFEYITDDDYDLIEDTQNILRSIYYNQDDDGNKFTDTDLQLLKEGKYNIRKDQKEDEKGKQIAIYNTYLSFLKGQSNNAKLNLETFKWLVTPLFIGDNGLQLSKLDIIKRVENHVNRFKNDFNKTMEIRNNPFNFKFSLERISTPSILHDKDNTYLINENIKPINGQIQIGVIDLENKGGNSLYDPISGDRLQVEVPEDNRKNKNNQVLYLVLEPSKGKRIAHELYVSNVVDSKIKTNNNIYSDYTTKSKEFIKNEFIKLITTQPTDDYENILFNLNKLINTQKSGEFSHFKNTPDNITFSIVLPYDEEFKGIRHKKVKINITKEGKFNIKEADIIPNKNIDKAIIDTSKDAKFNESYKNITNVDGSINLSETELRDKLDYYIPKILRNFTWEGTKLSYEKLNDTGIDSEKNTFYDPIDRYNEDGTIKPLNQRRQYDSGLYGHPYLNFVITTGAVKSNIGAIKVNNEILSNFNMGYNSEFPLSIHIKSEQIINKVIPNIEKVQTTDDLKNIESFKPYLDLLEGLQPMKINMEGSSPNENLAMKSTDTIYIYEQTIKDKGFNIENEIAHELIHARLDQELSNLNIDQRGSIAKDVLDIKLQIEKAINLNEGILQELSVNDKNTLSSFLNVISEFDATKKDLNTIQEMFTYTLTRPNVASALSKIKYIGDTQYINQNTNKSIWDKLLDLILKIIGVNNPSIMNNIVSILNSSLTQNPVNISEQTIQLPEILRSETIKTTLANEIKTPLSKQASRLAKKKNSLILNSNSDYKIVNSQEFQDFNNQNKDSSLNDNLEYFKKCYGIGNKAAKGMNINNFTKGKKWEIVKELKGKKHSQGGIDLIINDGKVNVLKKNKEVKANYGMIILR
jgi:hypothetical protein